MKSGLRLDGLRDLERSLMELKPATAKAAARKVLIAAAEPIAEQMQGDVGVWSGALKEGVDASSKLTPRQRAQRTAKSDVEVYAGAPSLAQAIFDEFGTIDQPGKGSLRRAWEGGKARAMLDIRDGLKLDIEKRTDRARRRAARLTGRR